MDKTFKVKFRNEEIICNEGITYREIAERYKKLFKYDILVAKVDNDLVDLSDTLKKNCTIEFYDRSSELGIDVYFKSAIFILVLAVKNILGSECDLVAEHSLDHGIYCTIRNKAITKEDVELIEKEMYDIVRKDYIYTKLNVSRTDAIKYFKKLKKFDKVNVLKYISNTYINLYRINDVYDYYHSKMAYSTSQINNFKLNYISETGLVISMPDIVTPNRTLKYTHHAKLLEKFTEIGTLAKRIGIENASDLNGIISKGDETSLINLSEAYYNSQLVSIADEIEKNKENIKVILLAGPSSSGKTTSSKKLGIYLRSKGINTYPISTDDYFKGRDKVPLDEDGEPDYESIDFVDTELFNKHLSKLLNKEKVSLPTYNFITGKREYNNNYLTLKDNDMIIIEGIHALNNVLTSSVNRINKYKIFIAPLTQLNIDSHNYIRTSDIRKLRRIIRDNKTRGLGAAETLKMWPKIKRGERNNIFIYQDEVDNVINSSLLYEICALKTYAEPLLFNVSEDDYIYPEALRLINFLRNFLPMPSDDVPPDSVLREFIGGSCFKK